MLRIYLIRHGETEWNIQGKYQGQVDTDLSERGKWQGERVGEALAKIRPDHILTSPLKRARETAECCAKHHQMEVELDHRLTEIAHGTWEGRYSEEIATTDAALLAAWQNAPHTVTMPQGESLADVLARVRVAFDEYAQKYDGQTIFVVAHDAVNKVIIADLMGMDLSRFWQIKQDNTCINVLEYEDGIWRLVTLNNVGHLGVLVSGIEQKGL